MSGHASETGILFDVAKAWERRALAAEARAEYAESLLRRLWVPDSVWPVETPDGLLDEWRSIVETTGDRSDGDTVASHG